eukprot:TRINITY_DN105_c0_g2_i1.p1 TRINITY_DN105_c0_g2~~TRINITY_DN105_c0_g2_i1.p1  ORF type:complete len:161 (-),score=35.84 TRINITY_DN105_c0_g2_i1:154-594(-)
MKLFLALTFLCLCLSFVNTQKTPCDTCNTINFDEVTNFANSFIVYNQEVTGDSFPEIAKQCWSLKLADHPFRFCNMFEYITLSVERNLNGEYAYYSSSNGDDIDTLTFSNSDYLTEDQIIIDNNDLNIRALCCSSQLVKHAGSGNS